MQRLHALSAVGPGLRVQFLDDGAYFKRGRGGGQGSAKTDGYGVRKTMWHLPEKPPFLVAENATPHAVEADGNDRRVHVFQDSLELVPERQQHADTRDAFLREDADDFALADGVAGFVQRTNQLARL